MSENNSNLYNYYLILGMKNTKAINGYFDRQVEYSLRDVNKQYLQIQ